MNMILSAKCAPRENTLSNICKAGLQAAELYLSKSILSESSKIIQLCKKYLLRYALHAPNDDSFEIDRLAKLAKAINPEIVVFHNIYWEDEWGQIIDQFKSIPGKLCLENVYSSLEPIKFMRRYDIGRCLDMEHLQIECAGIFEEEFISLIKKTEHIHLTGYYYGSQLWHTHIHHSPKHGGYMLDLLKKSNYSGFIVSEAKTLYQTVSEFKRLKDFFDDWKKITTEKTS